jgi:hypothetical protein
MINIRVGAFKTNSSNYHSFVIHFDKYDQIRVDSEYEHEDIWLDDDVIDGILEHLPLERLEAEVKWRKEAPIREERQKLIDKLWKDYYDVCRDCGAGNGCDDCRECEKSKEKDEIYKKIKLLENGKK